mmetsp:Transcript_533/g.573  ORF Transcript_533/g.573 Transcript_533/m.573 type:complete len:184 (+) Transcript_533:232-783(+)
MLDSMGPDELERLNQGIEIRSYLNDKGNYENPEVILNSFLTIKVLDERNYQGGALPEFEPIRVDPLFFNMMRFAELKRLILMALDRPFVLASSTSKEQAYGLVLDNMDFVKSSKLIKQPVMNEATGQYDWELGVFVQFDSLTLRPGRPASRNDSCYFPDGMTLQGCNPNMKLGDYFYQIMEWI